MLVKGEVPEGASLGRALFDIINNLEEAMEYTLNKFSDDAKSGGRGEGTPVGTPENSGAIQRDLERHLRKKNFLE